MSAAKVGAKLLAGQQLGQYFDNISGAVGRLANYGAGEALKAGTGKFMPNVAQQQLPAILRASSRSALPKAAEGAARLGVAGLGLYATDAIFDQQSNHSQPMSGGTGNSEMDKFVMSQQLQNQKFMHDMALVQARAESRIPGAQYPGSLMNMTQKSDVLRDAAEAERLYTDAGEITNREVQGIGRMIYGTGLRA
jgi:hypothetical protein